MSLLITLLSGGGGGGGGTGSVSGIILTPTVAASTANLTATYANGSSGVGATLTNGGTNLTAARVATTAALTVTYANGALGVGATLTNAGAQAALSIDSVALSVNDRVLVKDQAAPAENGVYSVTDIGSGSTNWVMTRVTDFDQAAEMIAGTEVGVTAGTTNAGTLWLLSTTVSVVGTDAVTWGATAAFTIDGQTPTAGQRVLIKDQTTAAQNGVYTVTTAGSTTALWVLTRATDFDQAAEMLAGSMVEVVNGTVNAGTVWTLTTTVVTVGSNSVTFSSINISTKVDQNGTPIYAADTGAADAYVITLSPAPSTYTTGMVVRFKASAANATTTPTINVNGLGAKTIVKRVNTALVANDILANQFLELIYDGTNFVLWSQFGNAPGTVTSVAGAGLASGTVTSSGNITVTAAVQSDQETGSSTSVAVVPGVQQYHPSAAKAWALCDSAGSLQASYNVTSITNGGTGDFTVNWATDFSSANYSARAIPQADPGGTTATTYFASIRANLFAAGTMRVYITDLTAASHDLAFMVSAFGDQ